MPRRNISYAEISVFAHATEDLPKVRSAILKILPDQLAHKAEFMQTNMRGHYGNHIAELRVSITDRRDAHEALQGILLRLSPLDEDLLNRELADYLDARKRLYLRLDKQRAFLGEAALASSDAINLVFRLRSSPKCLKELVSSLDTTGKHGSETHASP